PNPQQMADALAPGRTLPHVYSYDHPVRLCIYHPKKREWKPSMALAATVVPWAVMWLSFFEDWVCTDVWSGGGEHPETPSSQDPDHRDGCLTNPTRSEERR